MTDRDRFSLRGPAKSCEIRRTSFASSPGPDKYEPEERTNITLLEFRPNGFLTRELHTSAHHSLEWSNSYEYNEHDQLLRIRTEQGGIVTATKLSEYDSAGRVSRVYTINKDGNKRLFEAYLYGPGESRTKTVYFDPDIAADGFGVDGTDAAYGAPGATSLTSRYDERGRPTEHLFHDDSGDLVTRVQLRFDERSNVVEELCTQQSHPFELMGNLNEEQKEALRHLFGRRHRYDSQNRRIETSSNRTPADYDRITFAYNDQGDVISAISEVSNTEYNLAETGILTPLPGTTSAHRSETNLRYQYDSKLNWTEKIAEAPGGPIWSIERRSITYFDI